MMTVLASRWLVKRGAPLALALVLAGAAGPTFAQDTDAEARIRRLEAEVKALQRQVFPGGSSKYFTPEITAPQTAQAPTGTPANTAVTDMLTRLDAVEGQMARLTAQSEENANKLRQLEARLNAAAPEATEPVAPSSAPSTAPVPGTNLAAATPAAPVAAKPAAAAPAPAKAVTPAAKPPAAAKPSAARLAGVQAIEKPQTNDPADDEYSYGYRLWEAKFYPEAQQQLRLYVDKYPKHPRISFGRNLLGRAYLDDGKPREAATWFLQNFQNDKNGARASDSLLYLADSMVKLKDSNRACIALGEFSATYPVEAAGRLKGQYDATRNAVKCNR